jgi:membrane protease YdiL (CAAX protease family)
MSESLRPSAPPSSERPTRTKITFLAAALWTIGATVLSQLAVMATETFRPGAVTDLVNLTACRVLTYSILSFVMLRLYAPEGSVRSTFGLRRVAIIALPLAALLGAGLSPALSTLDTLIAKRFPLEQTEVELVNKLMETKTVVQRAGIAVSTILAFPLVHEVFFRGLLFGGLRRAKSPDGRSVGSVDRVIIATSVYFAASQGDPRSLPVMLALGLVAGWLRALSGSIWPAFVAHAAFFAVPVAPLLRGAADTDEVYPRTWIIGGVTLAVASAIACWLALRHDPRAEEARADDA